MTLRENLDNAIRPSKILREQAAKDGMSQLVPTVICHRGGELTATITIIDKSDRDIILFVCDVVAMGFEPDQITLVFESWHSIVMTNPITGKQWGPGEMSDVAAHHQGIEKGWIAEALCVNAANRAGDVLMATVPFKVVGRRVHWTEEPQVMSNRADDAGRMEGVIPEALVKIMNGSTVTQTAARNGFGSLLKGERDLAMRDCLMIEFLNNPPSGWLPPGMDMPALAVGLSAVKGSPREQVIKETLGRRR